MQDVNSEGQELGSGGGGEADMVAAGLLLGSIDLSALSLGATWGSRSRVWGQALILQLVVLGWPPGGAPYMRLSDDCS